MVQSLDFPITVFKKGGKIPHSRNKQKKRSTANNLYRIKGKHIHDKPKLIKLRTLTDCSIVKDIRIRSYIVGFFK